MSAVLTGILVYVLVQLAVGVHVSRRVASESDYPPAGRKPGPGLAAFPVFATRFGAETVVGSAGSIHAGALTGGSAEPVSDALAAALLGCPALVPLRGTGTDDGSRA